MNSWLRKLVVERLLEWKYLFEWNNIFSPAIWSLWKGEGHYMPNKYWFLNSTIWAFSHFWNVCIVQINHNAKFVSHISLSLKLFKVRGNRNNHFWAHELSRMWLLHVTTVQRNKIYFTNSDTKK
jgi:hypothetical protein